MNRYEGKPLAEIEWYHQFIIADIVRTYAAPRVYIEIGVAWATSFNYILPLVQAAHGVDILEKSGHDMEGGIFWHMTSDEFFEQYDCQRPHVIFIDGLHNYEQVKKDFENALELLREDGTIAIHDTFPVEKDGPCGDVYRLAERIENGYYPGLNCFTYRAWPGLTLVQRTQQRTLV